MSCAAENICVCNIVHIYLQSNISIFPLSTSGWFLLCTFLEKYQKLWLCVFEGVVSAWLSETPASRK